MLLLPAVPGEHRAIRLLAAVTYVPHEALPRFRNLARTTSRQHRQALLRLKKSTEKYVGWLIESPRNQSNRLGKLYAGRSCCRSKKQSNTNSKSLSNGTGLFLEQRNIHVNLDKDRKERGERLCSEFGKNTNLLCRQYVQKMLIRELPPCLLRNRHELSWWEIGQPRKQGEEIERVVWFHRKKNL